MKYLIELTALKFKKLERTFRLLGEGVCLSMTQILLQWYSKM